MAAGSPAEGQGIAVLGGTFNPLHVGHLRLAIEVHEAFAGIASRVDILPNSRPPHKANAAILPFAIRAALIRESRSARFAGGMEARLAAELNRRP